MPTITVDKYQLFEALGRKFTKEEFETLCFDFGIELDEDTEDDVNRPLVNGKPAPPELKIEMPANRYDLLCFEGIARNLNIFLGNTTYPQYRLVEPANGKMIELRVSESTAEIRPLLAGAVLRNVTFTQASYDSFIALQDKLHQNLARQRTLVSIGTHDLDTVEGPFSYEALPPKDIKFAPLNQTKEMNGEELMKFYESDLHLRRYLPIIRDAPRYPVIYDAKRTVCSLPPIINSNHSKMSPKTRNVLIEITATDATKLDIVCNIMVAMFSEYCAEPFTIEPVKIVSEHNGKTRITPSLKERHMKVEIDYLNSLTGLQLPVPEIIKMLGKMSLSASPSSDANLLDVTVPMTRADVLHQCDVMEDVAIGYGYNNLPRMDPNKSGTIGAPQPINKLTDTVRLDAAFSGWNEVMPLTLCSHDENFAWLNRTDDGTKAVRIANPKSAEFQVVRTSLIPGILKTIRENKGHALPIKVFEGGDVVFKDASVERKARNERHFSAAWYGRTSGFEQVHGLLDRLLHMLRVPFIASSSVAGDGYWLEEIEHPTFLTGRAAAIYARFEGKESRIGEFGILHPSVLEKFDLKYPTSTLEINLEAFL
ncbi:phenylalanine--tRNA ligase subunit beta [Ceratocystis pirilliformis]|uniref:phenylalanine--tRNA ligase n=1 Tax=Ceratocystis pirilliformis TaxID=259994 RepID=A0ABR3YZF5_9PEZI